MSVQAAESISKKVFQCQLCGKVLARHDDGYQHWLVCASAPPVETPIRCPVPPPEVAT